MSHALRALTYGLRAVGRAPALVAITYFTLLAVITPAIVLMERSLSRAFDSRVLENRLPGDVSATWFARAQAVVGDGAGETFAPEMFGLASILTNLSDLLETRGQNPLVIATTCLWGLSWSALLGGILHRLQYGGEPGVRAFVAAIIRYLPRFTLVSLAAAAVSLATAVAYSLLPDSTRPPALGVVVVIVGAVSVMATYSRAHIVVAQSSAGGAVAAVLRLVRRAPGVVLSHALLAGAMWGLIIMSVAAVDLSLDEAGSSYMALASAQAFIVIRIAARLVWEASALAVLRQFGAG